MADSDHVPQQPLHVPPSQAGTYGRQQTASFLDLPIELRLEIYSLYLALHTQIVDNRQPSSEHVLSLSRTCKQIRQEVLPILGRYVSLRTAHNWNKFIQLSDTHPVSWVDVANDGRVMELPSEVKQPMSMVYLALTRLAPSIKHLRVFDDQHAQFSVTGVERDYGQVLWFSFEEAMFPQISPDHLETYELYVGTSTKVRVFDKISSVHIRRLRLSGYSWFQSRPVFPHLQHLTIHSVTGHYFDQSTLSIVFPQAQLESFTYARGTSSMGFELRDMHLLSLTRHMSSPTAPLRSLVLLGVNKLTTTTLAMCLRALPALEYLALSFVWTVEMRENFILALPRTALHTFKFKLTQGRWSPPFFEERGRIDDAIETEVLQRSPPLRLVGLTLSSLPVHYRERWSHIAEKRWFALNWAWDAEEYSTT